VLALFTQCDEPKPSAEKGEEKVVNQTAREVYYQDKATTNTQLPAFKNAFLQAQQDSLLVSLPYAESGVFNSEEALVHSYDVQLREGEQLVVLIEQLQDSSTVLIDLFQKSKENHEIQLLKSSASGAHELTYQVTEYGYYKITVQPELGLANSFQLKMYTQPIYAFPVSGYGNDDVTSFWAANRGGGKRSHEGIDIFAPKGTPLIAITDGVITSINEEGKGGKQVRLKDERFNNTIYYAHLDRFSVEEGQQLRLGDTLGFVGNTGNAETTEPHLHFGIYKNITGPIDPYPYVKYTEIPQIEQQNEVGKAVVTKNKITLHQGPSSGLKTVGRASKTDTILILGQYRSWFHAATLNGSKGFVKQSQVRPL
jgi:murein DD-endopeptidase MepM/ murein hydrolase activator NlpD